MKTLFAALTTVGCLAGTLAVTATSADAGVVARPMPSPIGRGCRTVRTAAA